ncbi:MAG: hypothetical protein H7328_02005 [Bdellovibrio sp.]|nr:hypothetical protein [Bdellovibrio sp.]
MSLSKLKVGFLCSHAPIKKWQMACIEELDKVPNVEIQLLRCSLPFDKPELGQSLQKRQVNHRLKKYALGSRRLWNVFYYLFIRNKVSHFKPIENETKLKKFPSINLSLVKLGSFKYAFTKASMDTVNLQKFDVLINLELGFLTGPILNLPTHGVWSFHHGNEEKYRGLPPGFWEMYHNDAICGLVLQRLTEELDAGYILEKGFVPTHVRSYKRTLEMLFSVGAEWPAKVCRRILQTNYLTTEIKSTTKAKVYLSPNNKQIVIFLIKLFLRNIKYTFTTFLLAERWRIAVVNAPLKYFIHQSMDQLEPNWLPIHEGSTFKADPFSYPSAQGRKVIFESFDYRTRIGTIHSTRYDIDNQIFENPRLEIAKPHHLSYPFVFSYQNKTFSLVETYTEKKMSYFELTPDGRWITYLEVASDIYRNDNTLFEHEGLWYLFWTQGLLGANVNLNIAYSDSPFGPFTNHLLNPVKVDIRSARAAGALFKSEGKIYRPSQNSVIGYGSSINLNEVIKLSPTEFNEITVNEIRPATCWGRFDGLHTLSFLDENHTLIDVKKYEWIWINVIQVIHAHLRRIF